MLTSGDEQQVPGVEDTQLSAPSGTEGGLKVPQIVTARKAALPPPQHWILKGPGTVWGQRCGVWLHQQPPPASSANKELIEHPGFLLPKPSPIYLPQGAIESRKGRAQRG